MSTLFLSIYINEWRWVYSLGERVIIISVLYSISFIISLIYLCCRVDRQETSCIIFILCLIYISLFVFLNIIAVLDLIFNNEKGFEKLLKIITKFYKIFTIVDKALRLFIFTIMIYYLESGYYSVCKKLLDFFIRNYYKIKKMTKCEIIIILSVGIPFISGFLTYLIINRDNFGLESPIDYICAILDCYAIFQIYTCVGFFIVQLIVDCRRKKMINISIDIIDIQ